MTEFAHAILRFVASKRDLDARTPLNRDELAQIKQRLAQMSTTELIRHYKSCWQMADLALERCAPRPHVIQELVQTWRELRKRQGNR